MVRMTARPAVSPRLTVNPPRPPIPGLTAGIVRTVAYADIFDYPLSAPEIHRYLIGVAASREAVEAALHRGDLVPRMLGARDDFFTLPGREAIVETRREREQLARAIWPRALRYGRAIASLPFVRMVAITGELAMDNLRPDSDIDLFIVTEHRRLWLCRALVLGVVHLAATRGDILCPNYLLSERALALPERDLYTAHEIAQMVPLAGFDTYVQFRRANGWVYDILPNAVSSARDLRAKPRARPVRALAESALRTPAGALLERWEAGRKRRKFSRLAAGHAEASFTRDWCKGHVHDHGELILQAFASRCRAVERAAP